MASIRHHEGRKVIPKIVIGVFGVVSMRVNSMTDEISRTANIVRLIVSVENVNARVIE